MKNRLVLLVATLTVLASVACSAMNFGAKPTPTPELDPCCISTPSGPLKFEPDALPAAQVGKKYEAEIRITQNSTPAGDIFLLNSSLPAGLEIVKVIGEDTAIISGIPEGAGTFQFVVAAWCYSTMVVGQSGEKEYQIVVTP